MVVYVLSWNYYPPDAGQGIIRAYFDGEMARADLSMLKDHCNDKEFKLTGVLLLGEPPEGPTFGDPLTSETPAK